jgi:hypothetical protein
MKCLANELATLLLPAITSVLTNVIEKSFVQKDQFERAKANIRVIKYENDKLEQYTRRETIRIFNLKLNPGKSLAEGVVAMLNEKASHGYNPDESEGEPPYHFRVEDISVCHRLGKFPEEGHPDSRPVIVRFVRRQTVLNVFKYKKKS